MQPLGIFEVPETDDSDDISLAETQKKEVERKQNLALADRCKKEVKGPNKTYLHQDNKSIQGTKGTKGGDLGNLWETKNKTSL